MDNKQKHYFTTLQVPTWHKPPRFKESRRFDWINYGEANDYPDYLINLYNGSSTHQAIVSGKKDYIFGKGVQLPPLYNTAQAAKVQQFINNANRFEGLNAVLEKVILDYELFNGFALKIYQNIVTGKISEIYHVDWATCRINDDASVIYTSKQWTEQQSLTNKFAGSNRQPDDVQAIPAFDVNIPQRESILYFREYSPQMKVYPLPGYLGCNAAIETEIEISNFHLNNIKTGFSAGTMLTFTNGVPTEDEQREIEKQVKRKVAGTDNAGEIILYFTDGAENSPQVMQLRPNELDKQYEQLKQTVMDTIFVGHKVTSPMLFGVRVAGQLGGRNELREAYELFQNTYISKRRQTIEQLLKNLAQTNGIDATLTLCPTEPIGMGMILSDQDIAEALTQEEKRNYLAQIGFPLTPKQPQTENGQNFGYNFSLEGNLSQIQQKLMEIIQQNSRATLKQMAKHTFLTENDVVRHLEMLENKGLLSTTTETIEGKTYIIRSVHCS